jgi:hypothetical protein
MTNVIRLSPEGSGRNHRVAVDGAHFVPSGIDECQLQDPQGRTGLLAHASPHSPIPGLRGPVDYGRSRFGGVALRDAPASDGPDQAVIFRLTADPSTRVERKLGRRRRRPSLARQHLTCQPATRYPSGCRRTWCLDSTSDLAAALTAPACSVSTHLSVSSAAGICARSTGRALIEVRRVRWV